MTCQRPSGERVEQLPDEATQASGPVLRSIRPTAGICGPCAAGLRAPGPGANVAAHRLPIEIVALPFKKVVVDAMSVSAETLYKMPDVELLNACREAKRLLVEKRFLRDTQRARLTWIKARMFVNGTGGVTERNMAIEVSEEVARKGQELREMTRDLDLLKVDVDLIEAVIRLRSASASTGRHSDDTSDGDAEHEGHDAPE